MHRWSVILFCALVSTWQYISVTLPACPDCTETMSAIVAGDFDAPFVNRVLIPRLIVALGNTPQVLAAFHLVMLIAFFRLLWAWAEHWRGSGLGAVALVSAALVVMWPTYYFSVWSVTEWVLWLAGLMLLTRFSSLPVQPTAK